MMKTKKDDRVIQKLIDVLSVIAEWFIQMYTKAHYHELEVKDDDGHIVGHHVFTTRSDGVTFIPLDDASTPAS